MLSTEVKSQIVKDNQQSSADTGSAEVQIALLTANIASLVGHFKIHKKDKHSRRGLIRMVENRRKLIKYLKSKDLSRYQSLISKLGLRH
ncbi:MAG: 30S ribosomal protein S15 [Thiomargarita sp.]|nr:30S ribosomal protein S15 [Thiomargarita sp.]